MKKTTRHRRKRDGGGKRPVPGGEALADPAAALSREDIASRAYQISLTRDAGTGDPVGDWLQAEQELQQV